MSHTFINREHELLYLNEEYKKNNSSLIIVYGRRRVGKSELIKEFGKDKHFFYFLVTEQEEYEIMDQFRKQVFEFTGESVEDANWEMLFTHLIQHTEGQKLIITIDEFQYIGHQNKAFISLFQKIWDTVLKDANVMVVLCGSLYHMMESQVLSYSSPLYMRRTGQIKLKQLAFKHFKQFFNDLDNRSLVEFYAVTGGIPPYIELFKDETDIFEAIEKHVLNIKSFLYEEPLFLLKHEVEDIGSFFALIRSIAGGNRKLTDITAALEISQTTLRKYLSTLANLDIVLRDVPVTEVTPEKSKFTLYFVKDHFIDFWFKFIYPFKDQIEAGNIEFVLTKLKEGFISHHTSFVYERICFELMNDLNHDPNFNINFDKIGRWWDKDNEIDIVCYDSTGEDIIFCECKFTTKPIDVDIFNSLVKKAETVQWKNEKRKEHYILFCISGFTDNMINLAKERNDVILIDYV